jgi:gas vesicle protein
MRSQGILEILGGAALGAAAMYVLDPQAGAYRRHRLVEQTKPLRNEGTRLIESARHSACRGAQFVQQHLGKAGRSVRSLPRLAQKPPRYLEHAGSSIAGHTASLGQRLSGGWDHIRQFLGFRPRRSAISHYGTSALAVIGTACATCTAMYLLDPVSGQRRRAWIADKTRSLLNEVGDAVAVTWRAATHVSVRGAAAQAVQKVRSAVSHRQDQPAGV